MKMGDEPFRWFLITLPILAAGSGRHLYGKKSVSLIERGRKSQSQRSRKRRRECRKGRARLTVEIGQSTCTILNLATGLLTVGAGYCTYGQSMMGGIEVVDEMVVQRSFWGGFTKTQTQIVCGRLSPIRLAGAESSVRRLTPLLPCGRRNLVISRSFLAAQVNLIATARHAAGQPHHKHHLQIGSRSP